MENYFKQLNAINVSDKIERKGNLSYKKNSKENAEKLCNIFYKYS